MNSKPLYTQNNRELTVVTEQDLLKSISETMSFAKSRAKSWAKPNEALQKKLGDDAISAVTSQFSTKIETPLRLCLRVWSAYCKYLRQQCKKGRLIDTLYFGLFFQKREGDQATTNSVDKTKDNS